MNAILSNVTGMNTMMQSMCMYSTEMRFCVAQSNICVILCKSVTNLYTMERFRM